MDIVIDTSAILAVLLNEERKDAVIVATKGADLLAPASIDAEVGNALSAMFKRDRLTLGQAEQIIEQFEDIPIRRTKLRLEVAIQLASSHNINAYDAYMLDCAQQFQSSLLSLDRELITTGDKLGIEMLEV